MSAGPRIVFTRFVTADTPKLQPWADHALKVSGQANGIVPVSDPSDESTAVVWSVVSANNRSLARGARIFGSFRDANAAAREAQKAVAEADVVLVSDQSRGSYGWFLQHDGGAIVTSSRWYSTDRDRKHSIALATKSIVLAVLLDGARLMDATLLGG